MRRQARISAGGALVVRSASALQVWLWLLIFIFQNEFRISRSIQPGYLDFDNLPETNFTCTGKVIGGYYADLETSCQMFHVCTVGQQEEPMDIKFLCLNGTVFDQETRVCERVDEVDCTKSEKFYSLNLELYGSTAPPIITPESKPEAQPTEQSNRDTSPSHNQEEPDPSIDDESPTTVHTSQTNQQTQSQSGEAIESTEDPLQDVKKEEPKHPQEISPTNPSSNHYEDINGEYQDEDEYEDDYSHPTTTQTTTTTSTTTTTTRKPTSTSTILPTTTTSRPSTAVPIVSSTPTMLSSLPPPAPSVPLTPTLDPSLLSPQEFIYRHRGPGSEAISFQRQGFRPADGVYITHAPPQQFDHFKYESSRTAPRPNSPRPVAFVQRPLPAPFRPTTLDPRDQLLRPGPTSQSSERYESIQHRPQQQYSQALPAQRPLPFNPYHYERKRSDDVSQETESSLTARSVGPPNITERPPSKPKSPPRVIVTASASVSDSNGKKLNYTVGNVVNAVKPIVPINYDDYKESDLLFDPFFLDVPKLQKRRKTRSNNNNKRIFTIPATATISSEITSQRASITSSPVTSRATTTKISTTTSTTTTTAAWNPDDYVDDNYEPHAYAPPVPLAVLLSEVNKFRTQERQLSNSLVEEKARRNKKIVSLSEHPSSTSSSVIQTTSSQTARPGGGVPRIPPPPTPLEAPACAPPRSLDCRTRA